MKLSEIIKYYSQPEILAELVRFGTNREVVPKFGDIFGKRPDLLQFPNDVIKQVRAGATSWHASEELWFDPLQLRPELEKKELDKLRMGFDLILDIDCKILEWSKICAELLCKALERHEIKNYYVKFSGGSGFHIGVPWSALYTGENLPFPETPQIIAQYLKEFIKKDLAKKISEFEKDLNNIIKKSGKKREEILEKENLNPYTLLEIDTVALSSRHLLRMPYSLNEKKWLVSLPIEPKRISEFNLIEAKPENITKVEIKFLENAEEGEANKLLLQAYDRLSEFNEKEFERKEDAKIEFSSKVLPEEFPPCIKLILNGLEDGRKRSLFALLNFLKCAKWEKREIEQFIQNWNIKNKPPLKTGYVKTQINWHLRQSKNIPPPNCKSFYQDFGVCKPDGRCEKIKNPLGYSRKEKIIKDN